MGPQNLSFVEKSNMWCPLFRMSFKLLKKAVFTVLSYILHKQIEGEETDFFPLRAAKCINGHGHLDER